MPEAIPSSFHFGQKLRRFGWGIVYAMLFRPSPRLLYGWRRMLLRLMGASIAEGAIVHPSVTIWAPWNLEMGPHACLGPGVNCYSVGRVVIGEKAVVSQYAHLCAATHDYTRRSLPLIIAPIHIEPYAWVCADAFVGPGVTVGEGAVVGARAVAVKNVDAWSIVAGNPARFVRKRVMVDES